MKLAPRTTLVLLAVSVLPAYGNWNREIVRGTDVRRCYADAWQCPTGSERPFVAMVLRVDPAIREQARQRLGTLDGIREPAP
jgi:hypothetical protein